MSSNDLALSVRGLSKRYRIGSRTQHTTFSEALASRLKNPFRNRAAKQDAFSALNDISFDVQQGDVVGIIGRNGAGKSTLLKILSRITEPTLGEVHLYGRVGSLLEVGTGFHAELTGHENIYLNGAILGMRRQEIKRRFDEIVAFAAVEQFLDTPVKRYSSGMYVRLAFAVAAHLEPEILLVDEVLSVGDLEFQQKCIGKLHDVSSEGRTVLFVSHNMNSISVLCNVGIVLDAGRVSYNGPCKDAIDHYLAFKKSGASNATNTTLRSGTGTYRITRMEPVQVLFDCGEPKAFRFRIDRCGERHDRLFLQIRVFTNEGIELTRCDSRLVGVWIPGGDVCEGVVQIKTPWFKPGEYRIDACLLDMANYHWDIDVVEHACTMNVSAILPYDFTALHAIDAAYVLSEFEYQIDD